MSLPRGTTRRWWIGALLAVGTFIAVDQLILHTVLRDGVLFGVQVAPYSPPLFSDEQRAFLDRYEEMLRTDEEAFSRTTMFDAELGWCPRPGQHWGDVEFDWAGSRLGIAPLPREREGDQRLIAVVGCSFTFCSEVAGEETWAARLDDLWPEVRIGNFGVPAYGLDQVLLRYRRDVAPLEPDEVWLGFYPADVIRASSQFPPLYYRWRGMTILFKPRFSLDEHGELALHPCPVSEPADVPRLIRDPRAFFAALEGNDPWIARDRAAYLPPGSHWTHHSALGRLLVTCLDRGGRDASRHLADRTSELYRLNVALVLALAREVEAAGGRFRMLVVPGKGELQTYASGAESHLSLFVEDVRAGGIEVLDPTVPLSRRGVGQDDVFWMPGGHYSAVTNERFADVVAEAWGL